MTIDTIGILTLVAVTIVLGYIGNIFYKKTKIPDLIWLVLLGLIVGPLLGLVPTGQTSIFYQASPLFSAVALIIILFDAGLNMNFYQFIRQFPRATMLTVLGVTSSIVVVGYLSILLFNFTLAKGMLLGAMIGGTSTPVVLSIVRNLKIRWNVKTLLDLESILTDPIVIVVGLAFLDYIVLAKTNILGSIATTFSVGAVLGIVGGIVWMIVLEKIQKKKFDYILTVGIIILIYVITETLDGSGAIAALLFGLILGNSKIFSKFLRLKAEAKVEKTLKKFHSEITFFFRSFFFVYLGLIVIISFEYVIYGIVIAIILLVMRYFIIRFGTIGMGLNHNELGLMRSVGPRGLTAAILAQLPLALGMEGGEIFLSVSFVVILATVIYSTFWIKFKYQTEQ